jgi:hypothetical protein
MIRSLLSFQLASGGSLYAHVTTAYGMGKLELIEHDGKANLVFDERPYLVMADHAFVDLGTVDLRACTRASAMT